MMIRLQTYIPHTLLETLYQEGQITPDNTGSGFDRHGIYQMLSDISGFKTFFFGIRTGSTTALHADDLCQMSNDGNNVKLVLEIPRDECYEMDYYNYSDILYFLDYPDEGPLVSLLTQSIANGEIRDATAIQVIYPILKLDWVINLADVKAEYPCPQD